MRRAGLILLVVCAGCASYRGGLPPLGGQLELQYTRPEPTSNNSQVRALLGIGAPSLQKRRYTNYVGVKVRGLDRDERFLRYRWDPERESWVTKNGYEFTEDPSVTPLEEPTDPAAYRWAFEDLDAVLEQIPRAEAGVQP